MMRRLLLAITCVAPALALLAPAPAAAQGARDPALAETLFTSAQVCLARGDWACACDKFAASMTADPSVSTLFNIAKCQEHDGKLALAWASLEQALNLNQTLAYHEVRRKKLDEYGRKMAGELELRIPRLRISVAANPPGLEIRRNGVVVPLAALDEAIRVDPGTYEIVAQAPGYATDRRSITITEGQEQVVSFALASALPAPPLPYVPFVSAAVPARPLLLPEAAPLTGTQRRVGLVVGSVGIATLATAGVLAIVTAVDASNADGSAACRGPVNDDLIRQCNDLRGQARTVQTGAIITAIAGGAVFGAGIVVWASARKPALPEATGSRPLGWVVAAHSWGVSLGGRY